MPEDEQHSPEPEEILRWLNEDPERAAALRRLLKDPEGLRGLLDQTLAQEAAGDVREVTDTDGAAISESVTVHPRPIGPVAVVYAPAILADPPKDQRQRDFQAVMKGMLPHLPEVVKAVEAVVRLIDRFNN